MEQTPEIRELIKAVNRKFGKVPVSPSDFSKLSEEIGKATGIPISVSTLKRLWGYVKGYKKPRLFTFDTLCRYAGKGNWRQFIKALGGVNAQSDFFSAEVLRSDNLKEGDLLEVIWQPNRHCLFRYLGEERFVVERADNAKLRIGDHFRCDTFRDGQPLYLDEIERDGQLLSYVAGKSDGVLFRFVPLK